MPATPLAPAAQDTLRQLAAPRWTDHFDRLGGGVPVVDPEHRYDDYLHARPDIAAARTHLKERYGLSPALAGSLRAGLNVPGDVDIDFTAAMTDRAKYDAALKALEADPHFKPSAYNKPGMTHNVFTAPAGAFGVHPVDLAVSYGDNAKKFVAANKLRTQRARELPPDVAAALIRKKALLRSTPFDIKKTRYNAFKVDLERALEGTDTPTRIHREKIARILNMSSADDKKQLDDLLSAPDVYGHRTAHADAVLGSGRLMSGLEALSKGKLQSYEAGFVPGLRGELKVPKLKKEQLDRLAKAWLRDTPNYAAVDSISPSRDALKGVLIQKRLRDVNKFLDTKSPDEAEAWRREHLRISKLSPHIFLTQGGLTKDPGYGDTGILFRSKKPTTSPFLTLIQNESVLSPTKSLHMRGVNVRNAVIVAADDKLHELEKKHPGYTYVAESELAKRDKLLDTYHVGSAVKRLVPHVLDGTFKVLQG